ncbi:putative leucine-rich repeat domain superfamily [Helianthus annuus]|nr:putative leucine-rich repeat domain superfamily [Helianthus annuus]
MFCRELFRAIKTICIQQVCPLNPSFFLSLQVQYLFCCLDIIRCPFSIQVLPLLVTLVIRLVIIIMMLIRISNNSNNTTSPSFFLPPSLTYLYIRDFTDLESLSKGLQHLTCLEELVIVSCPKLRDLPVTLLPSLSRLSVDSSSPELRKKCHRNGKYWHIISQIPDYQLY